MTTSSVSPLKLELPPTSVQELLKTQSKHVPERYIYHPPNKASSDNQAEIKYMDSATIDLSLLLDSSSHQHDEELRKIQSVLNTWGCLQLVNHGLSSSLLEKIREVTKQFFDSPSEMKQKHSRTVDYFEGYGGDTTAENQSYNWNDKLQLRVYPLEKRNLKFWPEYIPNFTSKMAASSVSPMKLELPPTSVQELIKTKSRYVPERFIYRPPNNTSADNQAEIKYMDSPAIDLSLLSDSSSNQHDEELRKFHSVLSSWGCLQLINHGLPSSLLDKIREVGKEFFALPLEMKQKHSRTLECFEGYGGDTSSENQSHNWNDRLHLRVYPLEQRNFKFWPEYLPNFRETLDEYAAKQMKVLEMIMKAIAKSLNLEENRILSACGGKEGINMFTRFNYYPPCLSPDQVLGLRPHSDGTAITILLQDKEVEGLQVQKNNQWFKVPIVPGALFINIGDQLEIMSNGILKSAVHKVVIDKERERISVVVLGTPHFDKEVGPFSELIDKERPQQYKNIQNYVSHFFQYFSRGERAIDAMKI